MSDLTRLDESRALAGAEALMRAGRNDLADAVRSVCAWVSKHERDVAERDSLRSEVERLREVLNREIEGYERDAAGFSARGDKATAAISLHVVMALKNVRARAALSSSPGANTNSSNEEE